jgi:Ca2+-binding EF-hand superfamily protein
MRHWTSILLAAALSAAGANAQDRETYNLNAATADLAVFHRLARDGVLRREDARSEVGFASRFDDADRDRDGVVTAAEMRSYVEQAYGVVASGAGAEEGYRRHAATRDLEAFQQLAQGGSVKRAEAQEHPIFGPRFDEADLNADGVVTAQEMERYVLQRYGIVARSGAARSGPASVGSSRPAQSGSASAGSSSR